MKILLSELRSIIKQEILKEFWSRRESDLFRQLDELDRTIGSKSYDDIEADPFMEGDPLLDPYTDLIKEFGLEYLGGGASRYTYAISSDMVIKLNYNDFEGNQNELESSVYIQNLFKEFVPKVYKKSKINKWIISERVTPVRTKQDEKKWMEEVGLASAARLGLEMYDVSVFLTIFHVFFEERYKKIGDRVYERINNIIREAIQSAQSQSDNKRANWNSINYDTLKQWTENRLVKLMIFAIKEYDVGIGDFGGSNIGFGSDGRPVVLDVGITAIYEDEK